MPERMLLVVVLALVAIALVRTEPSVSAGTNSPRGTSSSSFLYTVAKQYEPLAWISGADRFPFGATIMRHDSSGNRPLVPAFAATADSSVSFDGKRVLFTGKLKPQDPWQIWEVPLAGGKPRRITAGSENCIRPFYLPGYLREDRVVYARKTAGRFVIEVAELSGGTPLPLTYGPANFLPTDILRDGRILLETSYPVGTAATPELYTVYSDGSGFESYRCDHGNARHEGRQINSGDIVFASRSGLARFTSALAKDVPVSAPAGEYIGEIAETASGDWLLPWRADAKAHYQLMIWKPGAPRLRHSVIEQNADAIQPTLIGQRIVPKRHPSGLHDWPNANLLCLNAYTSKYKFAADSIHSVRFYTRDGTGETHLLGTAPVERDGSFFVHVPSDQPLQIELLDGAGGTLKRESGYFWMRRGEQRICVGCHAGPETAPENAVPMILLKSTTPTDMTGETAHNASGGR